MIGLRVGRAILERDEFRLAGRLATFDQHVGYAGDGGLRGDSREAALAKNRGLQRELRGKAGAHLRFGARRSGLVVEDGIAPVIA